MLATQNALHDSRLYMPFSGAKNDSFTRGLQSSETEYLEYTPLPSPRSIRLIEWPKDIVPTKELRCTLKVVDFDSIDRPSYTALSYTWASSTQPETDVDHLDSLLTNTIICNDKLLRVTENAHDALSELRWRGRSTLFWVDSVSIDQSNPVERSQQVSFMGEIFAEADRVIVWLGEDDADAKVVYDLSQKIARAPGWTWEGEIWNQAGSYILRDLESYLQLDFPPELGSMIQSLFAFFSRSWFQRLWVIQEVVLAKNIWILCGGLHFDWFDFNTIAQLSTPYYLQKLESGGRSTRATLGLSVTRLISWLRQDTAETQGLIERSFGFTNREQLLCATFGTLASTFREALASDDRDRIFAPLALAKRSPQADMFSSLVPDYTQSVEEVYISAARYLLENSPYLGLLSLVETSRAGLASRSVHLPSWVPDFRVKTKQNAISWNSRHNATKKWQNSPEYLQRQTGRMYLQLKGVRHVTISQVTPSLQEGIKNENFMSLIAFFQMHQPASAFRLSPLEALESTLTAGNTLSPDVLRDNLLDSLRFRAWVHHKVAFALARGIIREADTPGHLTEQFDQLKIHGAMDPGPLDADISSISELHSTTKLRPPRVSPNIEPVFRKAVEICDQLSSSRQSLSSSRQSFLYIYKYKYETPEQLSMHWRAALSYESAMEACVSGRSMVLTEEGDIGLAPDSAQVGDEVWFLAGARVPLILRPLGGEKGHYRFVGEAYLGGYMRGEFCEKHGAEELRTVVIG